MYSLYHVLYIHPLKAKFPVRNAENSINFNPQVYELSCLIRQDNFRSFRKICMCHGLMCVSSSLCMVIKIYYKHEWKTALGSVEKYIQNINSSVAKHSEMKIGFDIPYENTASSLQSFVTQPPNIVSCRIPKLNTPSSKRKGYPLPLSTQDWRIFAWPHLHHGVIKLIGQPFLFDTLPLKAPGGVLWRHRGWFSENLITSDVMLFEHCYVKWFISFGCGRRSDVHLSLRECLMTRKYPGVVRYLRSKLMKLFRIILWVKACLEQISFCMKGRKYNWYREVLSWILIINIDMKMAISKARGAERQKI